MALLDWLQEHSIEELETLIDAIDAGELPDDRVARLRELIEEQNETIKEEAVQRTTVESDDGGFRQRSVFNDLEAALGLSPTPPPMTPAEPGDVDVVSRERKEAINRIEPLLQPGSGRGAQFFDELARAFQTGSAVHTPMLTQGTLDALDADDLTQFQQRAEQLADAAREAREKAREESRETAERDPPTSSSRSRSSGSSSTKAPPSIDEFADPISEPPTEPYQDEDYMNGQTIVRDPVFEAKFIRFARSLGRARDLDLLPKPADDYFALTPRNQRKFYDVTPKEFMIRNIRRGNVTRDQLLEKFDFAVDDVPTEDEI